MTKKVRIENADSSNHKVVVQVWRKSAVDGEPDVLAEERQINNPADLAEVYIHQTQYITVREAPAS